MPALYIKVTFQYIKNKEETPLKKYVKQFNTVLIELMKLINKIKQIKAVMWIVI